MFILSFNLLKFNKIIYINIKIFIRQNLILQLERLFPCTAGSTA